MKKWLFLIAFLFGAAFLLKGNVSITRDQQLRVFSSILPIPDSVLNSSFMPLIESLLGGMETTAQSGPPVRPGSPAPPPLPTVIRGTGP
jgi:hypothetical protein